MDDKTLLDILKAQKDCFTRYCNHNCELCPLARNSKDVIEAYDKAIKLVKEQKKIKTGFFNSGIECAKAEFRRLIEQEMGKVGELHKNKVIDDILYTQILGLQKAAELTSDIKGR